MIPHNPARENKVKKERNVSCEGLFAFTELIYIYQKKVCVCVYETV